MVLHGNLMVPALLQGNKNVTLRVRRGVEGEEVNTQEDRVWMLVVHVWH